MQIPAAGRATHRQGEEWLRHLQIVHESRNARGGVGQEKVEVRESTGLSQSLLES